MIYNRPLQGLGNARGRSLCAKAASHVGKAREMPRQKERAANQIAARFRGIKPCTRGLHQQHAAAHQVGELGPLLGVQDGVDLSQRRDDRVAESLGALDPAVGA